MPMKIGFLVDDIDKLIINIGNHFTHAYNIFDAEDGIEKGN